MIQDFAFIGVKNLIVKDKKTKKIITELPNLLGFNLSDNQPIEYLRGGFERLKLLPFKGDRETSVTVTSAAANPGLLELQLNTEFEEIETLFDVFENYVPAEGVVTINPEKPVADEATMTVYALDNFGAKEELEKGESVETGKYTYSEGTLTVSQDVPNVRVIYKTKKKAYALKAKDVDTKAYEISAVVVAQEIGTADIYDVQVDIPSAVMQLNNQLDASNEGGVPDGIEITIDMLKDATKDYVYMIALANRD